MDTAEQARNELRREAARRRTFAIISHPDAGKTTLTERLLLYSGAIHLAGSVQARKNERTTASDWMKMERERGISISSSVLQFEYEGAALNLLDTPGHADFSEDTYRTLAAVDSALMLIDHAKGVEQRTLKLFQVCRMRKMPVVTWMNKLDREGLHPLELLDDLSNQLNLKAAPLTWPIGMGKRFKGIVDILTREVILYEPPAKKGGKAAPARKLPLAEAAEVLGADRHAELMDELELLEAAGDGYSREKFLSGETSPVFFGSAMNNFGVEPCLRFLADAAAAPGPRETEGDPVHPDDERFTGFVFKIQANMNPKHRDRMAFIRVVSGRFRRGMDVILGRTGKPLRMANPHTFMAKERSIVEEAWPGDIVGLHDPGSLRIGDTLCEGDRIQFAGIPRFAPEHFARVELKDPLKRKQLSRGIEQLSQEGVVQAFYAPDLGRMDPYLGAVGRLQFEVLQERLRNEYNVRAEYRPANYNFARWVLAGPESALHWFGRRQDCRVVEDRHGRPVVLSPSSWALDYAKEQHPGLELSDVEPL